MEAPETFTEAVELARRLMEGDASTFKQGYSLENAAMAVEAVYDYDAAEIIEALTPPKSAGKNLWDLPVFGWAWQNDARDLGA